MCGCPIFRTLPTADGHKHGTEPTQKRHTLCESHNTSSPPHLMRNPRDLGLALRLHLPSRMRACTYVCLHAFALVAYARACWRTRCVRAHAHTEGIPLSPGARPPVWLEAFGTELVGRVLAAFWEKLVGKSGSLQKYKRGGRVAVPFQNRKGARAEP